MNYSPDINSQRRILKAIWWVISGIGLLLIISTALNIRNAQDHVTSSLKNRSNTLIALSRPAILLPLVNGSGDDLKTAADDLLSQEEDLVYLVVLDESGEVIAYAHRLQAKTDAQSQITEKFQSEENEARIVRLADGRKVYEVAQTLDQGGMGRWMMGDVARRGMMEGMMGRGVGRGFRGTAPSARYGVVRVGIDVSKWDRPLKLAYFQAASIVGAMAVLAFIFFRLQHTTQKYLNLSEKARAMQEAVERSERLAAIGSLAAGVAHEIRNPLGSVMGFLEVLQRECGSDGEVGHYFEIITKELKRLDVIVNDLLTFSRQKLPQRRPVDITSLIDGALSASVDGKYMNVLVAKDYPSGLPQANLDPDQMKQVLINILLNAFQATEGKGSPTVGISARAEDGMLIVSVTDNGVGIKPEDLSKIFNPFFTTKPGGTGLGLAIAHQIVEGHGGSIEATGSPGQGATFTVKIPLA
jgi:signal transduction histidine kinase